MTETEEEELKRLEEARRYMEALGVSFDKERPMETAISNNDGEILLPKDAATTVVMVRHARNDELVVQDMLKSIRRLVRFNGPIPTTTTTTITAAASIASIANETSALQSQKVEHYEPFVMNKLNHENNDDHEHDHEQHMPCCYSSLDHDALLKQVLLVGVDVKNRKVTQHPAAVGLAVLSRALSLLHTCNYNVIHQFWEKRQKQKQQEEEEEQSKCDLYWLQGYCHREYLVHNLMETLEEEIRKVWCVTDRATYQIQPSRCFFLVDTKKKNKRQSRGPRV